LIGKFMTSVPIIAIIKILSLLPGKTLTAAPTD
jgi:hypothetical protein